MDIQTLERPITVEPVAAAPVPLCRADRCDNPRCGAQAHVRITMTYGFIDLCGHHYRANEDALMQVPSISHIEDKRKDIS